MSLIWMTYFNGFLPAHDKHLADLTSFNIIHYTQPNEMGRAWNLLSYSGLHLMADDAVATKTIQSSLFSPDTLVYWFPLHNFMYSHQCNCLYSNCSNLQQGKTFLWQIPKNKLSVYISISLIILRAQFIFFSDSHCPIYWNPKFLPLPLVSLPLVL
jgi:hypothetical protein